MLEPTIYFLIGHPSKTHFATEYCRENRFLHLSNPSMEDIRSIVNHCIIEGELELFQMIEKVKPDLNLIYLGQDYSNEKYKQLRMEYLKIGKCIDVANVTYQEFRRQLNPNLIFIFGPILQQCHSAAMSLANTIKYVYSFLPSGANEIIANFDKTKNYVFSGFFSNSSDIKILKEYFIIRVIRLGYERQNLPKYDEYFDIEYDLLPQIISCPNFKSVAATDEPMKIMDKITQFLCPKLIFLNFVPLEHQNYVNEYIQETNGLKLSILEIQHLRKRKNLILATNSYSKVQRLTQIFYKDLNRKQILLSDFPFYTNDFIDLQNMNRKISCFLNLCEAQKYEFSKEYSAPIYYLENQKRFIPSMNDRLSVELAPSKIYWIVNGTGVCGKTTVCKFLAAEFGHKLIDYQAQCAAVKEKLQSPEDGEEVPVQKFINYFANIVKSSQQTCVFDGVNYEGDNLKQWVEILGAPHVINLKVEGEEQIKRTRKKGEQDLTSQITEQQTAKATQSIEKNVAWIENLSQIAPSSKIYQVNYKFPQLLSEPLICSILKPRIFLVQANNSLTYQNIALKYNMGFINLKFYTLSECSNLIKSCGKRDIIICGYKNCENKLVSEELYWIQKNLGQIRYLGIWSPEEKQFNQKMMELERPPVEQKPKKAEGEEEEEEEKPEEDEDGPPKKKFDIYEYKWTQPVCHKNLSQWYFKLKNKIHEKKSSNPRDCFNKFGEILQILNENKEACVYQIVS